MIPVNTPLIGNREKELVNECLDTGWISSEGAYVKRFEEEFSKYIGRQYGIAVSNGSAALDIAMKAIGISKGDEVIMPAFTIISPAFSIVQQGGIPVLVDCDPITWNMNVKKIEEKITDKTKAICVVHIYGLPVDIDPIIHIAKKYNLRIVEDAAEMHGQTYKNRKCGSFGDISIFSFYPNKHITTGEGGMILTDNQELAQLSSKYRNLSFDPQNRRFVHEDFGWNYRITNIQAAIGIGQLERIEEIIDRKHAIGKLYNKYLEDLKCFQLPLPCTDYSKNIYWVYGLIAESEDLYEFALLRLKEKSIGTRPFFWPIHQQPVFNKMGLFNGDSFPVAEKLAKQGFYIPSGVGVTDDEIKYVSEVLLEIEFSYI